MSPHLASAIVWKLESTKTKISWIAKTNEQPYWLNSSWNNYQHRRQKNVWLITLSSTKGNFPEKGSVTNACLVFLPYSVVNLDAGFVGVLFLPTTSSKVSSHFNNEWVRKMPYELLTAFFLNQNRIIVVFYITVNIVYSVYSQENCHLTSLTQGRMWSRGHKQNAWFSLSK